MHRRAIGFMIATVVMLLAVVAVPATGQDRTEERLSALETRVAELEAVVLHDARSSVSSDTGETYTLTGEFTLNGRSHGTSSNPATIYATTRGLCEGTRGFDDLTAGVAVTIRDDTGTTIAIGRTGQGEMAENDTTRCIFPFEVTNIPKRTFYSIEIGHRGEIHFTFEEMEQHDWFIALEIGDR